MIKNFSKLNKNELSSILTSISLYINEAKYEERSKVKNESIYNPDGTFTDSFNAGYESGVNVMCNALRELMK